MWARIYRREVIRAFLLDTYGKKYLLLEMQRLKNFLNFISIALPKNRFYEAKKQIIDRFNQKLGLLSSVHSSVVEYSLLLLNLFSELNFLL